VVKTAIIASGRTTVNRIDKNKPKRLLGIVGSMRRLGNCELFIKETARLVPEPHELSLIRLPQIDIRPCTGCYQCIITGSCRHKDDVAFVTKSIGEADGLIIAAPVYFLGAHGCIKNLLDRAFSFYGSVAGFQNKPCILACTHAMPDKVGVSTQMLRVLAAILCLDVVECAMLDCTLPGEVITNPHHRRTATRLAHRLFGRKRKRRTKGCPFCGNDIVRMVKDGLICTLCHGRFTIDQGRATRQAEGWPIGEPRFVKEHTQWLKGMKDRFVAEKKGLLRVTLPYEEMGTWLIPPSSDRTGA
jgi:NAD(P)H-dependent FMN reductase